MTLLLKGLFYTAMSIFTLLLQSFVMSKYWAWFITSKFESLPTLTYLNFVGIIMCYNLLFSKQGLYANIVPHRIDKKVGNEALSMDELLVTEFTYIFILLFSLLSGYVYHQFI